MEAKKIDIISDFIVIIHQLCNQLRLQRKVPHKLHVYIVTGQAGFCAIVPEVNSEIQLLLSKGSQFQIVTRCVPSNIQLSRTSDFYFE